MNSPQQPGSPSAPQGHPYAQQPHAQQPQAQQPYAQQPYAQQPPAQQPYAPQQPYAQQAYAQQPPVGAPQPGYPQAQPQLAPQPVAAPTTPAMGFSANGGDVRLHFQGGAFDPQNLLMAVTTGKGFDKPRTFGLGLLGLATAFTIGNWVLVMVLNRFYPYFYSLAAIFGWAALWLVLTGQPCAQADGSPAPTWGRYGLGACLVLGVLMGIAMVVMPWERMM